MQQEQPTNQELKSMTNEERVKVFSMYWGTECLFGKYKRKGTIGALSIQRVGQYCKLLLTPLSQITDEDAIEVAGILEHTSKSAKVTVERREDRIVIWWGHYTLSISHDGNIRFSQAVLYMNLSIMDEVGSKLREKGYALPYKGKSLFELGIAIEKSNQ